MTIHHTSSHADAQPSQPGLDDGITLSKLEQYVESNITTGGVDFQFDSIVTDILDELPVAVFVKDSECRHVFVNKCHEKMFNRVRANVLGKTDCDLFPTETSSNLMDVDRRVIEEGETFSAEEIVNTGDGRELTIETSKVRLVDTAGKRWLLGITRDVTEAELRETELQKAKITAESAERSKSEFLANMSHEIRTPMNGIMGMAELLSSTDLDSKQKMFANVILKSGTALLVIINDILDFSKINAGQLELIPDIFALGPAVEDVATLVSTRAAEKDLELIVRVDPQLPEHFIGDVGRIRQILTNLLGNAVKFTEKGYVWVDVGGEVNNEKQTCSLHFRVEDTGIGIPEDKLVSVFEKFSQVDASATRRHEGTGLGLSITRSLVHLMNGEIGVTSEVGKGSTFWFRVEFPIGNHTSEIGDVPADISGARIVVIDDNPVNRSILSEQLEAWNFEHAELESGELGLMFLRKAAEHGIMPDMLILDYQMPGMNGEDVLREIRTDSALSKMPVMMLTSVDTGTLGRELIKLGICANLPKPARSSMLFETIVDTISRARAGANVNLAQMPVPETLTAKETAIANAAEVKAGSMSANGGATHQFAPLDPTELTEDAGSVGQIDEVATSQPDPQIPPGAAYDILVAEDNAVNQILMRNILDETGYTYEIVENGRLAVDAWLRDKPRLVLMDVSMPEMNGTEATASIRRKEAGADAVTPIIGVTAHALKGDREKCIEAGMDDYISKPISVAELKRKLDHYLAGSNDRSNAA